MIQRASTEGPEQGTSALTTTSTFLRLQPARSNDNYAPKSVSQMDDNNERRGAEGQKETTTTPATGLEEDHQFGTEERY
ncbi:MAG: hypothetical protein HUU21_25425 [Polyangiaceae bacterium]|nr:hypothetical protein [Polyangiaceae bacterium]